MHRLVDPMLDLEAHICIDHNELLTFFCERDQLCVCATCLRDNHERHEAVPVELAFRKKRDLLVRTATEIEGMETSQCRMIEDLKCSAEQSRKNWEEKAKEIDQALVSLVSCLQRSRTELAELMQEKQKSAQVMSGILVTNLEQEVADWQRRRSELERVLQREDQIHLLQTFAALSSVPQTTQVQSHASVNCDVDLVKNAVARMQAELSEEMEMLNHQVRLLKARPDGAIARNNEAKDLLMMIKQRYAVDVILDASSANSRVLVSEDGKTLFRGAKPIFVHNLSGNRFSYSPLVCGTVGFSSDMFYYQVQISGAESCLVGVVKESINRNIVGFPLPCTGGWTLLKATEGSQELYNGSIFEPHINLRRNPTTVGVFVDYTKGEVSFYDADTGSLLYSHRQCVFNESSTTLKDALFSFAGISTRRRTKLYPILGVYGHGTLIITPVASSLT